MDNKESRNAKFYNSGNLPIKGSIDKYRKDDQNKKLQAERISIEKENENDAFLEKYHNLNNNDEMGEVLEEINILITSKCHKEVATLNKVMDFLVQITKSHSVAIYYMMEQNFHTIIIKEMNNQNYFSSVVCLPSILEILIKLMSIMNFEETSEILSQIDFKSLLSGFISCKLENVHLAIFYFLIFCMIIRPYISRILMKNSLLNIMGEILSKNPSLEIIKICSICFNIIEICVQVEFSIINKDELALKEVNKKIPQFAEIKDLSLLLIEIKELTKLIPNASIYSEKGKCKNYIHNCCINLFCEIMINNNFPQITTDISNTFLNNRIYDEFFSDFAIMIYKDDQMLNDTLKYFILFCKGSQKLQLCLLEVFNEIIFNFLDKNRNKNINDRASGKIIVHHFKEFLLGIDDFIFIKLYRNYKLFFLLGYKLIYFQTIEQSEIMELIELISIILKKVIEIQCFPLYELRSMFINNYKSLLSLADIQMISNDSNKSKIELSFKLINKLKSLKMHKVPTFTPSQ